MALTIREALKFGGLFGAVVVAGQTGLDTPIESISVLEVAEGSISSGEYMDKLNGFVGRRTQYVKQLQNQRALYTQFQAAAANYKS